MLSAARLHTKWGPRAPGVAHLGPGRPGSFPVGPRSPSPPNPARLPLTLFSAMGSLSCSADITDRRAWLAPGPREAGVFDAAAPPPLGPPPGPPGPPLGPWSPPGRARSSGRPGRGRTLKSLGGSGGLGAPCARGAQLGSAELRAAAWGRRPRPAGRRRAPWAALRCAPPARGGDAASADTKAPGLQRPLGGRGAAPRPPRPACAPQPSTGPGFGGGDPGRAEPRTLTRTRTGFRGRGLAGRLRSGTVCARPCTHPAPSKAQYPRPCVSCPRPAARAPRFPLPSKAQDSRWLCATCAGRKGAMSCSTLPATLQDPKPSKSESSSSAPRAAFCPPGPRTPGSTPLCTPSPSLPEETAAPNFIPATARFSASQSDFRKKLCQRKQHSSGCICGHPTFTLLVS